MSSRTEQDLLKPRDMSQPLPWPRGQVPRFPGQKRPDYSKVNIHPSWDMQTVHILRHPHNEWVKWSWEERGDAMHGPNLRPAPLSDVWMVALGRAVLHAALALMSSPPCALRSRTGRLGRRPAARSASPYCRASTRTSTTSACAGPLPTLRAPCSIQIL